MASLRRLTFASVEIYLVILMLSVCLAVPVQRQKREDGYGDPDKDEYYNNEKTYIEPMDDDNNQWLFDTGNPNEETRPAKDVVLPSDKDSPAPAYTQQKGDERETARETENGAHSRDNDNTNDNKGADKGEKTVGTDELNKKYQGEHSSRNAEDEDKSKAADSLAKEAKTPNLIQDTAKDSASASNVSTTPASNAQSPKTEQHEGFNIQPSTTPISNSSRTPVAVKGNSTVQSVAATTLNATPPSSPPPSSSSSPSARASDQPGPTHTPPTSTKAGTPAEGEAGRNEGVKGKTGTGETGGDGGGGKDNPGVKEGDNRKGDTGEKEGDGGKGGTEEKEGDGEKGGDGEKEGDGGKGGTGEKGGDGGKENPGEKVGDKKEGNTGEKGGDGDKGGDGRNGNTGGKEGFEGRGSDGGKEKTSTTVSSTIKSSTTLLPSTTVTRTPSTTKTTVLPSTTTTVLPSTTTAVKKEQGAIPGREENIVRGNNFGPGGQGTGDQVVPVRHGRPPFSKDDDVPPSGHFMAYFLTVVVFCVVGYVVYHNKQKIFAFIIEGRQGAQRGRRPNTSQYKKLESDVMPSLDKSASSQNYIY